MTTHNTVDSYIASFPEETQTVLKKIRSTIQKTAPDAEELMNYGVPTYQIGGKNLVHFGGFKKHVGFYPGASGIATFEKELSPYKHAKGSVQFPLDEKIPYDLIKTITTFRLKEMQSL